MKIKTNILAAMDGSTFAGATMTLAGQLDRKTYQEVARVIEAAGGKWSRKDKAHVFDGDARDAIEPVLLTGEVTNRKQDFGQFYTPADIVQLVLMAAGIRRGDELLEPSAGRGDIAGAAVVAGAVVDCVESDMANVKFLKQDRRYRTVFCRNFLDLPPNPIFDVVAMNPPFAKQDDIRHVLHAAKFLKPGGRIAAIMSASVSFRQNKLATDFRAFVADRGGSIVQLPEDAFKESGTSVNTVLVSFVGHA